MTFSDTLPLVWPMAFILVALCLLRKVETDLRPVFINVVGGVALNAKQYSLMYAMAFIYGSAASLQALGDFAVVLQHTPVADRNFPLYLAGFCKVSQPGIVAVIAYVTKPPQFTQANPDKPTPTNPPFAQQPQNPKP